MPQLKQPRFQSPAGAERREMIRVPIQGAPEIPADLAPIIAMLIQMGAGGGGLRGGMPRTPVPSSIPQQRVPHPTSIEQPGLSGMSPLDTLKWLESRPAWARARALGR